MDREIMFNRIMELLCTVRGLADPVQNKITFVEADVESYRKLSDSIKSELDCIVKSVTDYMNANIKSS